MIPELWNFSAQKASNVCADYDGITDADNQPTEAHIMKQANNPSVNGACNWTNRVLAPWSKQPEPKQPLAAPSGLRAHAAHLREAVVQVRVA